MYVQATVVQQTNIYVMHLQSCCGVASSPGFSLMTETAVIIVSVPDTCTTDDTWQPRIVCFRPRPSDRYTHFVCEYQGEEGKHAYWPASAFDPGTIVVAHHINHYWPAYMEMRQPFKHKDDVGSSVFAT